MKTTMQSKDGGLNPPALRVLMKDFESFATRCLLREVATEKNCMMQEWYLAISSSSHWC